MILFICSIIWRGTGMTDISIQTKASVEAELKQTSADDTSFTDGERCRKNSKRLQVDD
jgi:hypothetical protein